MLVSSGAQQRYPCNVKWTVRVSVVGSLDLRAFEF